MQKSMNFDQQQRQLLQFQQGLDISYNQNVYFFTIIYHNYYDCIFCLNKIITVGRYVSYLHTAGIFFCNSGGKNHFDKDLEAFLFFCMLNFFNLFFCKGLQRLNGYDYDFFCSAALSTLKIIFSSKKRKKKMPTCTLIEFTVYLRCRCGAA